MPLPDRALLLLLLAVVGHALSLSMSHNHLHLSPSSPHETLGKASATRFRQRKREALNTADIRSLAGKSQTAADPVDSADPLAQMRATAEDKDGIAGTVPLPKISEDVSKGMIDQLIQRQRDDYVCSPHIQDLFPIDAWGTWYTRRAFDTSSTNA